MSATVIDGKALAAEVRASARPVVARLVARGIRPGLAVILAGDDPGSRAYVRNKMKACAETGLRSDLHQFAGDVAESVLLERIAAFNEDPQVHGILVQLPLPRHVNVAHVIDSVAPSKDVDGFHPQNLGALVCGRAAFVPCTPAGVMRLLERAAVPLAGSHAVVLGRSNIVGKPMALLLLQKDATVTICHSKTAQLRGVTRQADVLVAAVGRPNLVTADMVKPGACVIDVGINRLANGSLAGDVDFAAVKEIAGLITPVPGGVGPMTIAMLICNTVDAATRSCQG